MTGGSSLGTKAERPVSIVLPTYNGAAYLSRSLQSCIDQVYRNWELIVVDDASTDETPEIIRDYVARDSRIRSIRNDANRKLPASLNEGFSHAMGELLTWTSDDNQYRPEAINRLAGVLEANPDVDVVYSDHTYIDAEGRFTKYCAVAHAENLVAWNCVGACFLYRRKVHEELGGYSEDSYRCEDWDFWLRGLTRFKFMPLHEDLYLYRLHPNSITGSQFQKVLAAAEKVLATNLPRIGNVPREPLARGYYKLAGYAKGFDHRSLAAVSFLHALRLSPRMALGKWPPDVLVYIMLGRTFSELLARPYRGLQEWVQGRASDLSNPGLPPVHTSDVGSAGASEQPIEVSGGTSEGTVRDACDKRSVKSSCRPLVSVVIPAYNHEAYVGAAVNSVLNSTVEDLEIVVVDDGSRDGTADAVASIADPRITLVRQENRGAHAAINRGASMARAEWMAILNSDDMFHPTKLERHLGMHAARPELEATADRILFVSNAGTPLPAHNFRWKHYERIKAQPEEYGSFFRALLENNSLMSTSTLFAKKAVILELGGFLPLRYCHDWFMFLSLAARGGLATIDEPLTSYRVHASNTIDERPLRLRVEEHFVLEWHLSEALSRKDPRLSAHEAHQVILENPSMNFPLLSFLQLRRTAAECDPAAAAAMFEDPNNPDLIYAMELVERGPTGSISRRQLDAILNTWSWKVTAPLRWGFNFVKRALR
ncbi:MAG: glycosyltransferase [Pseudomonadota bacterium]